MKNNNSLTTEKVKYIARLANLPLADAEVKKLSKDLSETLNFINKIKQIDTKGFRPTDHVTGLENIFRNDEIIPSLSQTQALSGVSNIYKGYFKVNVVLAK